MSRSGRSKCGSQQARIARADAGVRLPEPEAEIEEHGLAIFGPDGAGIVPEFRDAAAAMAFTQVLRQAQRDRLAPKVRVTADGFVGDEANGHLGRRHLGPDRQGLQPQHHPLDL